MPASLAGTSSERTRKYMAQSQAVKTNLDNACLRAAQLRLVPDGAGRCR